MTDFSKVKFHCSTLKLLMSDGRAKTPAQEWEDACELLLIEQDKYELIANKESKAAVAKFLKMEEIRRSISELELHKDEDVLSESAKGHLTMVYGMEKYAKWSLPTGKGRPAFIENGLVSEDKTIQLVSELDNKKYRKNESVLTNEFLRGTPDILDIDDDGEIVKIIEVKSSWNMRTFFMTLKKELFLQYWWQVQGYMYITGTDKAEVSYCLVSPPEDLVIAQIGQFVENNEDADIKFLEGKYDLDAIPAVERRIRFEVDRDEDAISQIPKRIVACRKYLSEIELAHESRR